jgi:hypothetical protein
VQNAGVSQAAEAVVKSTIELSLTEVARHPGWTDGGFDELPPPTVKIGCGSSPAVYDQPPEGPPVPSFFAAPGKTVVEANYFRVFVFVLPEDEIVRLAGDPPFYLSIEESLCSGDACRQVTTGLYVSERLGSDEAFMQEQIKRAIGLERPF